MKLFVKALDKEGPGFITFAVHFLVSAEKNWNKLFIMELTFENSSRMIISSTLNVTESNTRISFVAVVKTFLVIARQTTTMN